MTCEPQELDPSVFDGIRIEDDGETGSDHNNDGEDDWEKGESDKHTTKVMRQYLYFVQDQVRYETLTEKAREKEDQERQNDGREPREMWILEYLREHSFLTAVGTSPRDSQQRKSSWTRKAAVVDAAAMCRKNDG